MLTPTLAARPRRSAGIRDDADPAADFEAQKRFTPFTAPCNVTGQPAVSLPLHWTDAGCRSGSARRSPGDEATLLSLAAQVEAAAPWQDRRPPLW